MSTLKQTLILVPAFMLLSACGGGDDACIPTEDLRPLDSTTDTSATCANTRGANTIVIAYPITDAIEQLSGGGSAIYSRKGSAIVTDQNGNAVPDDTVVQLDVFDSLIARGIINAGDSISGSIITDLNPLQGDRVTAAILNTAVVDRNGDSFRTIKTGDLVLLRNAAAADQIRYVSSTTANSITVNAPYTNSYPSANYPNAEYLVGQALVGTSILGIDDTGAKTAGVALTKDGLANFRLEYPGDSDHLNYGAVDYAALASGVTEPRAYAPQGSTEVWVVANVGASVATADQAVLSGIADTTTAVAPATAVVDGATTTADITVTVEDATGVRYPLVYVSGSSSDESAATVTGCLTGASGTCTATITRVAAGTATISLSAFGISADVAVTSN